MVVAAPPGLESALRDLVGPDSSVVTGGDSRSESVANALGRVASEFVAVHDAARPLAPPELFDEVTALLGNRRELDGVIAAAPVADTVKRATEEGDVLETVDREGLWAVQTPQAFRASALRSAIENGDIARATDDASLIEATGGRIAIHPWARPNPKLTTPADLVVIEALLEAR